MRRWRVISLITCAAIVSALVFRTRHLRERGQFGPTPDLTPVIDINLTGVPLEDALAEVQRKSGVRIDVNWGELGRIGIYGKLRVGLRLTGAPLPTVLRGLLGQASTLSPSKASYYRAGDTIQITSIDVAVQHNDLCMFDVGRIAERFGIPQEAKISRSSAEYRARSNAVRLLIGVDDEFEWQGRLFLRAGVEEHGRIEADLRKLERMEDATTQLRPMIGPFSLARADGTGDSPVHGNVIETVAYDVIDFKEDRSVSRDELPFDEVPAATFRSGRRTDDKDSMDTLRWTIENFIDRESWRDNGGSVGAIKEIFGILVVTQTPENQRKVQLLLRNLRKSLDAADRKRKLSVGPAELLREP